MGTNSTPFILSIFAGILKGSFGVSMEYMAPLNLESWWLTHIIGVAIDH